MHVVGAWGLMHACNYATFTWGSRAEIASGHVKKSGTDYWEVL